MNSFRKWWVMTSKKDYRPQILSKYSSRKNKMGLKSNLWRLEIYLVIVSLEIIIPIKIIIINEDFFSIWEGKEILNETSKTWTKYFLV